MSRTTRLALLLLLALVPTPTRAADRPNILLILADDLGYGDLSSMNPQGKINTPSLDRLTAQGISFTDAHSASAVCSPTRYGIPVARNERERHGVSVPMLSITNAKRHP